MLVVNLLYRGGMVAWQKSSREVRHCAMVAAVQSGPLLDDILCSPPRADLARHSLTARITSSTGALLRTSPQSTFPITHTLWPYLPFASPISMPAIGSMGLIASIPVSISMSSIDQIFQSGPRKIGQAFLRSHHDLERVPGGEPVIRGTDLAQRERMRDQGFCVQLSVQD